MSHGKALVVLLLAFAVVLGGVTVTRHVVAVASEADAARLHRSILDYIA